MLLFMNNIYQNSQRKETGTKLANRDKKNSSETSVYPSDYIKEVKEEHVLSPCGSLIISPAKSLASLSQNIDVLEENIEKTNDLASNSAVGSQTSLFSVNSQKEDIKDPQLSKKNNNSSEKIYIQGENFYITPKYKRFIENLNQPNLPSQYLYYCRCCDTIVFEEKWSDHLINKDHISADKFFRLKSVKTACEDCKMILYGEKRLMLKFFKYHNLILHNNTNENKNQNSSEILNNPSNEECNTLSASTSLSGSVSSLQKEVSHNSIATNKITLKEDSCTNIVSNVNNPHRTEYNSLAAASSLSDTASSLPKGVTNSSKARNKKTPKEDSSNNTVYNINDPHKKEFNSLCFPKEVSDNTRATSNKECNTNDLTVDKKVSLTKEFRPYPDGNYSLAFVDFIGQVKQCVKKSKHQLEAGFCVPCNKGFTSGFDWFDHMEDSHPTKEENSLEAQCEMCLVTLFGNIDVIYDEYLESYIHWELDNLIEEGL